jgi:hypothetical protein
MSTYQGRKIQHLPFERDLEILSLAMTLDRILVVRRTKNTAKYKEKN